MKKKISVRKKRSKKSLLKSTQQESAPISSSAEGLSVPTHLNINTLAAICSLTDRQIRNLETQRVVTRDETGEFPTIDCLRNMILYYKNMNSANDVLRLRKAQADKAELELDQIRGGLLSEDDAKEMITYALAPIRKSLEELPTRLCAKCNPLDPEHAYNVLRNDLDQIYENAQRDYQDAINLAKE